GRHLAGHGPQFRPPAGAERLGRGRLPGSPRGARSRLPGWDRRPERPPGPVDAGDAATPPEYRDPGPGPRRSHAAPPGAPRAAHRPAPALPVAGRAQLPPPPPGEQLLA